MMVMENPDLADRAFRNDVLTFRSQPQESSLQLAGPVTLHAKAATSGPEADLIVFLLDEELSGALRQISPGQQRFAAAEPIDVTVEVGNAG